MGKKNPSSLFSDGMRILDRLTNFFIIRCHQDKLFSEWRMLRKGMESNTCREIEAMYNDSCTTTKGPALEQ